MTAFNDIPENFAQELVSIVSANRGGRGVSTLCRPSDWRRAARAFSKIKSAAVVSGFYIPAANAPETDGPGGAVMLARAFMRQGIPSEIWTDSLCVAAMKACASAAGYPAELVKEAPLSLPKEAPEGIVFTERLGRAKDGGYYNFRKEDISCWTPPLDRLADEARLRGVVTLGIGDGGNEVGMGNFYDGLCALLPEYRQCLCTVTTDYALAVDVSNWGAYALCAALSHVWGEWRGPEPNEELSMLRALSALGVVDGISRTAELTVDGFDICTQDNIILSLHVLWNRFASR